MKRLLLVACAALSLASAAYGQSAAVSETIPLHYIAASRVPATVKTIEGIEQLTCNFKDNSVTVRGSQKAVADFKTELRAADVQATIYRLQMRLVRYHVDAEGKRVDTVLTTPTLLDSDKMSASCSITQAEGGYAVLVTPRQETDKRVTLTVEVQELGEQGEVVRSGKNAQSVKLGETVRIVGMTDATDKAMRRAVQHGEIVTDRGEYTGYFVEVKPTVETPAGTPKR